jgi:hypothetical protein
MQVTRAELVTDMAQNSRNVSTWVAPPLALVGALALLTALLIEGRLNQQTFAVGCVIVMALAVIIWTVVLKRSNRSAESFDGAAPSSRQNVSKKKGLQIALLLLFLVVAFWMTRGGPWIPRLIGAYMLILFTMGVALRKTN